MSQPDSHEFARQMLYHMAALTAELEETKLLLCDALSKITNRPAEEIRSHYKDHVQQRTDHLYFSSLRAAKIDVPGETGPPDDPPFPGREADPRV